MRSRKLRESVRNARVCAAEEERSGWTEIVSSARRNRRVEMRTYATSRCQGWKCIPGASAPRRFGRVEISGIRTSSQSRVAVGRRAFPPIRPEFGSLRARGHVAELTPHKRRGRRKIDRPNANSLDDLNGSSRSGRRDPRVADHHRAEDARGKRISRPGTRTSEPSRQRALAGSTCVENTRGMKSEPRTGRSIRPSTWCAPEKEWISCAPIL